MFLSRHNTDGASNADIHQRYMPAVFTIKDYTGRCDTTSPLNPVTCRLASRRDVSDRDDDDRTEKLRTSPRHTLAETWRSASQAHLHGWERPRYSPVGGKLDSK